MIFQTQNSSTVFGVTIHKSDYYPPCRESYKEKEARLARLPLPAEAGSPRRELIYGGAARPVHRYIIEQQISVRTPRVDTVAAAVRKTVLLLQKGIVLGGNPNEGVAYRFTGLNSVKLDMITEATRNARAAAERFASDSGSKVGAIRQANQGIFSIVAADHSSDTTEPGGFAGAFNADSSIMKTVRVVTTVEYYLEK